MDQGIENARADEWKADMLLSVLEEVEPEVIDDVQADITTSNTAHTDTYLLDFSPHIKVDSSKEHAPQEVHLIVAQQLDHRGNYQDAITAYEDFIEAAASNDDTIGQLHAYIRIAQLHRRLKQYRQSVTSYTHILQLAQEVKDMNLICRAYTQLGNLYLILAERASNEGDSEENEERLVLESDSNYSSLYTIGMSLQDRNAICHARRGLGLVHAARGEWIEARTQFERHLALCSAIGTADQKAQACHLLAEALRAISSSSLESALGASRALFKRQVELRWEEAAYAAEAGDMLLLMRAYMQLGDLYSQSGSYTHFHGIPKARECYSKVLKIGKETNLSALGSKGADIARDAANKLDALDSGACIIS